MRVDADGQVSVFYKEAGDRKGSLSMIGTVYVTTSCVGAAESLRISTGRKNAEVFVARMNLVRLAFSATGDMAVASTDSIYSLEL